MTFLSTTESKWIMGTHSNTNYSGILSNAPAVPLCLPVFGPTVRSIWAVVLTATVLSEVLPIPHMTPVSFYSYCAGKAVMFLAVGYLTPLAFWRFDDRGFLLCGQPRAEAADIRLWTCDALVA